MSVMGILSAILSHGSSKLTSGGSGSSGGSSGSDRFHLEPWKIAYVTSLIALSIGVCKGVYIIVNDIILTTSISISVVVFVCCIGIIYYQFKAQIMAGM